MKIIGVIVEEEPAKFSDILGSLFVFGLLYPLFVVAIWIVNGNKFVSKLFTEMFNDGIGGFIVSNIIVLFLGPLCLFFGLPLKLIGII
jgi:TRAP-type mannitol/chloroaromatic compound transport system permease large subunit